MGKVADIKESGELTKKPTAIKKRRWDQESVDDAPAKKKSAWDQEVGV